MDALRVFVSSSVKEFAKERNLIIKAFKNNPFLKPIVLEKMGARPSTTEQNSLKKVAESELYLGIFGRKFSELTIREYLRAIEEEKPCFIYVKDENRVDRKLREFIEKEVRPRVVYYVFSDFKDLIDRISEDLQAFLIEVLYEGFEMWNKKQKELASKHIEVVETPQTTEFMTTEMINKKKQLESILSGQPQWLQVLGHVRMGRNSYKELLKEVNIPTYSAWFRIYDLVKEGKLERVRTTKGTYFYITTEGINALNDYLKKKNLPLAATYIDNFTLHKFE